ncbi:hypothetical protein D9M68_19930 [compost metagenome]
MSDDQNAKPETILDDPALALKAKKEEGMEGEPTLRPAYYENNPRLVVKTKVPNDKNHGKIEAALSNHAFFAVMRAVEAVANSKEPCIMMMDNKGHRFVDKKRDPNPSIMSSIKIEKGANGVVSICISAGKNRPLIEFPFLDTTYHNFRDGAGVMGVATASRLYALAWVDVMREYMGKVIERHYKRPAWMDRNNGGGQGGGNNNWGNRGGQGGGQQQGGGGWGGNNSGGGNNNWKSNQGSQSAQPSQGSDFNFDDDVPL